MLTWKKTTLDCFSKPYKHDEKTKIAVLEHKITTMSCGQQEFPTKVVEKLSLELKKILFVYSETAFVVFNIWK